MDDMIERAARALTEWELGLKGKPDEDDVRFGKEAAESRRATVNRLWPSKIMRTRQILEAGEAAMLPPVEGGKRQDLFEHIRDRVCPNRRELSDEALVNAYNATDGEPSNPEADALGAEIKRRDLDV